MNFNLLMDHVDGLPSAAHTVAGLLTPALRITRVCATLWVSGVGAPDGSSQTPPDCKRRR